MQTGASRSFRVAAPAQPILVVPFVRRRIGDDGSALWRVFGLLGEGVGLFGHEVAEPVLDLVLVDGADPDAGQEDFPHAALEADAHGMAPSVPVVEIAQHAHLPRVRRPDRERRAVDTVDRRRVRTEFLEDAQVVSLDQQMNVQLAEHRSEPVRVLEVVLLAVVGLDAKAILERLLAALDDSREEPLVAHARQIGDRLSGLVVDDGDGARLRLIGPYHHLRFAVRGLGVHTQDREWVAVVGMNDAVDLCIQLILFHDLNNPVERCFILVRARVCQCPDQPPPYGAGPFCSSRRNAGGMFRTAWA